MSSSRWNVRKTSPTASPSSRTARATPKPSSTGIWMSSTATCGASSLILARASPPSPASATTLSPAPDSTVCLSPCRTIGWSSAMMMSTALSILRLLQADADLHGRPPPRRRLDRGLAAEHPRALGDVEHAEAAPTVPRRAVRGEAPPVVSNGQNELAPDALYRHARAPRARVLDDVADALLHDAVEVDLLILGERAVNIVYIVRDAEAVGARSLLQHRLDGHLQAELVELQGAEVVRDLAHLLDGVRRRVRDFVELFEGPLVLSGPAQAQRRAVLDDGEALPDAVVQLGGDALALRLLRADELAREGRLRRPLPLQVRDAPLEAEGDETRDEDEGRGVEPPRPVEGRDDDDAQRRAALVPDAVAVRRDHGEGVFARREV